MQKKITLSFKYKIVMIVISCILVIPSIRGFFENHHRRSQWEKRSLAKLPEWHGFTDASAYFSELNLFIDDHFGYVRKFNKTYRKVLFYLFKDSPTPNISIGDSGFIYLNSHDAKTSNRRLKTLCVSGTDPDIFEKRKSVVENIFSLLKARNYTPSLGIAVSKIVLYPEYLPETIPEGLRTACDLFRDRRNIPTYVAESMSASGDVVYYPLKMFYKQKGTSCFYPKENFHWSGNSAHVFSKGFLKKLNFNPGPEYDEGGKLVIRKADLNFGFSREINVWDYPYEKYGLQKHWQKPGWVKDYFAKAQEYCYYTAKHPMSDRQALIISNSFGIGVAKHLAPGFKKLYFVNINFLEKKECKLFFSKFIDRLQVTDIIIVIHDEGLVGFLGPGTPIAQMANTLEAIQQGK